MRKCAYMRILRYLITIFTKFGTELRLGTAETPQVQKRPFFSKSNMAADEKPKFTTN